MRRQVVGFFSIVAAIIFLVSCGQGGSSNDGDDAAPADDTSSDDAAFDDDSFPDDDAADDDVTDDTAGDDTGEIDVAPILDEDGRTIVLHGANFMAVEANGAPIDYERMTAWGFNVVRILMTWQALEPQQGVYDENYLPDVVAPQIEYANAAGIRVILDMHQYHWSSCCGGMGMPDWLCEDMGSPPAEWLLQSGPFWDKPEYLDAFVAAWDYVADFFAQRGGIWAYDLFNEPIAGLRTLPWTFENPLLRPLYIRLIEAVRARHPDPYLILEPSMVSVAGLPVVMDPLPYERLIYSPHLYPGTIAEGGAYTFPRGWIEWQMSMRRREALRLGIPLLIGETGLKSAGEGASDYARDAADIMDGAMANWTWWAFGYDDGSMGLDDAAFNAKPEFYPHLARPYPRATAGRLRSFRYDEDARVFSILFDTQPDQAPALEIYINKNLHYPDGFSVRSTDADGTWDFAYDDATSVLAVTCDPAAATHAVTVAP